MRLILFLAMAISAIGQTFHTETNITTITVTNVVQVPCRNFYYYGLRPEGGVTFLGTVEDHNAGNFENAPFQDHFRYILRTDQKIELAIVKQPSHPTPVPPPFPTTNTVSQN